MKRGYSIEVLGDGNRSDIRLEKRPDNSLRVVASESQTKGKGFGTLAYKKAVEYAKQNELKLESDISLTPDAYRRWKSLKKDYKINENPFTREKTPSGEIKLVGESNLPIFELDFRKKTEVKTPVKKAGEEFSPEPLKEKNL